MISPKEFLETELKSGVTPDNPKFVELAKITVAQLEKFKGLKVLDYGAGTGVYAKAALDAGHDIKAVDIWKEHRDFMKDRYPDLEIGIRPVKADVLMFIEVAEHMTDEEITKMIEKVDPDAVLFSSTPYKTEDDKEWGHINVKIESAWVKFFKALGFTKFTPMKKPTSWTMLIEK